MILNWLHSLGSWSCQHQQRQYFVRLKLGTKSIGAHLSSTEYNQPLIRSSRREDIATEMNVCEYSERYDPRHFIGDTNWNLLTEVYADPVCRWAEGYILSPMELLAQDLTREENP